jgi:putative endonuclease
VRKSAEILLEDERSPRARRGLVWFEHHDVMASAIQREYRIKEWKRAWKLRLIEDHNPTWADLYEGLV